MQKDRTNVMRHIVDILLDIPTSFGNGFKYVLDDIEQEMKSQL